MPDKGVFNCHFNEANVILSFMWSRRLFQAVLPATQKARFQNLVYDVRLSSTSRMAADDTDRNVEHLSQISSLMHRSEMYSGAQP